DSACHFHPAKAIHISRDAAIKGFGDALSILRALEFFFITGITDERNLRQNRRHVCPYEYHERRLLNTPIADSGVLRGQSAVQRLLHISSTLPRLFALLFHRALLDQVFTLVDALL